MDLFSTTPEAMAAPAAPKQGDEHGIHIPYAPPTRGRGDDKAQALFAAKSSAYETPKKSNHSTRTIPPDVVAKVEEGDVTYEAIQRLAHGHPIYAYQTCLTIHGRWPQVQREHVGGYKHLRQNQNGSMEILWPAIDHNKKRHVAGALKAIDAKMEYYHASSSSSYGNTVHVDGEQTWNETIARYKRIMQRVKQCGVIASSTVWRMNMWGALSLSLEVQVQAIPAGTERALILALADLDNEQQYAQALKAEQQRREQERERQAKADQEREAQSRQRQQEREAKDRKDMPKLEAWMNANTTRLPAPVTPVIGQVYSKLVRTGYAGTGDLAIRQLRWEKGTFGRMIPYTWIGDEEPVKGKQCKPAEYKKWPQGWTPNK